MEFTAQGKKIFYYAAISAVALGAYGTNRKSYEKKYSFSIST